MNMDFPASPTEGQVFASGGTSWQWNGYAWIVYGTSSGGTGDGIEEAPIDNVGYGRYNAGWTPVLMLTNDLLDGGNF